MSRATKAQKPREELERQALEFFERLLAGLTDPRRYQARHYPLRSVVAIALMAMVCGADDAERYNPGRSHSPNPGLERRIWRANGSTCQILYAVLGAPNRRSLTAIAQSAFCPLLTAGSPRDRSSLPGTELGELEFEPMSRLTQAQQIQQQQEEQALAFFEATLAPLPDPRRAQGQRYPLRTVIITALMAMVCGCDGAEAMQLWGEANAAWLAGFLEMPVFSFLLLHKGRAHVALDVPKHSSLSGRRVESQSIAQLRYSAGDTPVRLLNSLEKCWGYSNPSE